MARELDLFGPGCFEDYAPEELQAMAQTYFNGLLEAFQTRKLGDKEMEILTATLNSAGPGQAARIMAALGEDPAFIEDYLARNQLSRDVPRRQEFIAAWWQQDGE